ncbi:MAG TPA: ABC transporter permease [Candidatus Saccharimonadales bacterium]|nr:ABC transporter permease [Candidatus Saccharimonadales bacterium]
MNKMIVANLVHRPVRSIISMVAVAVEVTLILLMVGLSTGILNDNKARQSGIGADVMVKPPGSSWMTGLTGAPVPIKAAAILRRQPHIAAVTPVVTQLTAGSNLEIIYGIDVPSFEAVGGPLRFVEGGPFAAPDDMIVDDFFASAHNVHAGSTVEVLNHQFRVSGVVVNGRGARRYISLATMQELIGAENKASIFYVKLDDPKNADAVSAGINTLAGMEKYSVMTMQTWLSLMSPSNVPGLSVFIDLVIGISVAIGFIVIFQSMYTAVMERTREIGVLKSLGASKLYIVRVILRETLLLAVGGILVGILVSAIARLGILHKYPTLRVEITALWALKATVIAVIGAMLGAVYPAFKAARKDPIDALAYE